MVSSDTVSLLSVGPAAAETRESGQPAGGVQEEKTAPLGVRVLRADSPQRAGQTPSRVRETRLPCL